MRELAHYWEDVRRIYVPFEASIRSGTADVYRHEMPGGQYTNLREQARAMGLDHRWDEVAAAYADVNRLFGDIVKVTPTSKVVGDMAIYMVANDLTAADVLDPKREIAFPESVISLFKGELGFPPDGFPEQLSRRVLRADPPKPYRPGDHLPDVDLDQARAEAEKALGHKIDDTGLASWLMYPKVTREYAEHRRKYGDVSVLPTQTFFYGMREREEISVDIEPGKTLMIRLHGTAPSEEEGGERAFFELNGQPRTMRTVRAGAKQAPSRPQADPDNPNHLAAPMPGMIVTVAVKTGQRVEAGDPLVSIEAMKMETQIRAERGGKIKSLHVRPGETVAAHDLLLEYVVE
jgi:pyruvate carboxylase